MRLAKCIWTYTPLLYPDTQTPHYSIAILVIINNRVCARVDLAGTQSVNRVKLVLATLGEAVTAQEWQALPAELPNRCTEIL